MKRAEQWSSLRPAEGGAMGRYESSVRRIGSGLPICVAVAFLAAGCFIFRSVKVEPVATNAADTASVVVEDAVKAHLVDGSTVLYPYGVRIAGDTVRGSGTRWDIALANPQSVLPLPLDSVLAMEAFSTAVDAGATFGVSLLATVAVTGIAVAIACAADPKCFGSCPTFYSDSAGALSLEAEGFSYAIAPLLETRDVDRLRTGPSSDGRVRLEVRNEALETHYLNHLELLEVRHEADEFALPDRLRQPVAVRDPLPATTVRDRDGRDRSTELAAHDGMIFETSPERLAGISREDFVDWLDVTIPVDPGVDSVALVFRMRNSLLTTVLLYDLMLGDRGAYALTWLSDELTKPMSVVQLGTWAVENLGLRVKVPEGDGWRVVGRFGDAGPVAWKDVAMIVPVTDRPNQKIRVEFVADNWRIDRLAYANDWRRLEARSVPLVEATAPGGESVPEIVDRLAEPDSRYLRTSMGERFTAVFQPDSAPEEGGRTFFLASQGWYSEWIRRAWLQRGREREPFQPGAESIVDALERWRDSQEAMERAFYATRVPVR